MLCFLFVVAVHLTPWPTLTTLIFALIEVFRSEWKYIASLSIKFTTGLNVWYMCSLFRVRSKYTYLISILAVEIHEGCNLFDYALYGLFEYEVPNLFKYGVYRLFEYWVFSFFEYVLYSLFEYDVYITLKFNLLLNFFLKWNITLLIYVIIHYKK